MKQLKTIFNVFLGHVRLPLPCSQFEQEYIHYIYYTMQVWYNTVIVIFALVTLVNLKDMNQPIQ